MAEPSIPQKAPYAVELAPGDSIFPRMSAGTTVKLSRDCAAIQIPVGTEVTLKAATPVDIVQRLQRELAALGLL